MKVFEIAIVVVFGVFGIRSLVHWARRPFDSGDPSDHLLFAMFVTGRVGLWFALSGLFLLYALTNTQGRAFVDDVKKYDWFVMVFVSLAALQFLGGYFLGRRQAD